jgi:predicted permease
MLTRLYEDFLQAFRLILGNRAPSLAVFLSLTLGIGTSTAMFGVVDSFMLRPIQAPESDRIVRITAVTQVTPVGDLSYPDVADLRKTSTSFETIASTHYDGAAISVRGDSDSRMTVGVTVSHDLFAMLQVRPMLGRTFLSEDEQASHPVVLVSHSFWQRELAGDAEIIGKTIAVNRKPLKIIGVLPQEFTGVDALLHPQFYVPRKLDPTTRNRRDLSVFARLKPGVTVEQARAEVRGIAAQLEKQYPETNRGHSMTVHTQVGFQIADDPENPFLAAFFFIIGGLVLAIACVNVSNLMLSTVPARTRETAVRLAMGASQMRLLRQFLLESCLLSGVSTVAGLVVAWLAARFVSSVRITHGFLPVSIEMRVDTRVALYALAIGLTSGALSALIPAIRCSRGSLDQLMRSAGPRVTRSKTRFRQLLVAGQVAFATMVLLVSALSLQDIARMRRLDPGFRVDDVFIMGFDPGLGRGFSLPESLRFYEQLLERVRQVPGVESAGLSDKVPLGFSNSAINVEIEGYEKPKDQNVLPILASAASGGYFTALGIPITRGRDFGPSDTSDGPKSVIINEAMAQKYWPGKDPLGKRVKLLGLTVEDTEVVGIVATSKFRDLEEPPTPFLYVPVTQNDDTFLWLFIATKSTPAAMIPAIRNAVRDLDPNQPIYEVRTMADTVRRDNLWDDILITQIATGAGIIGLALGILGLYGILAYSVSERTREIGIRIAVGATNWNVYRMVLLQGLKLSVGGIIAGSIFAFALLATLPESVTGPDDPAALLAYLVVVAILLTVSLLSSLYPARRAARVDPVECLRCE